MVKETGPPKAINVVRPSHSLSSRRPPASAHLMEPRKPKVASTAKISISSTDKHKLNIFHPPSRQQQQQQRQPGSYEIYRPRSTLSRSITTPTVSSSSTTVSASVRRPRHVPRAATLHGSTPIISNTARPLTRSKTIVPAMSDRSKSMESYSENFSEDEDEDKDTDDEEEDEEQEDDEDDEISEARVNRKIADLEISNRSLLAVNEMLEMTVRKQASQVAKLKKQISQGDYPLPPPPPPPLAMDFAENDEDDNDWQKDEQFYRLYKLTEKLIEQGEESLRFQYKNLGRVISQYSDTTDELDTLTLSEPSSLIP